MSYRLSKSYWIVLLYVYTPKASPSNIPWYWRQNSKVISTLERSEVANSTLERSEDANSTLETSEVANSTLERSEVANSTLERSEVANSTVETGEDANSTLETSEDANSTLETSEDFLDLSPKIRLYFVCVHYIKQISFLRS
jgi:hypothetical protein